MYINFSKNKSNYISRLSEAEINTLRTVAFLVPITLLSYSYFNQGNTTLIAETWTARIGIAFLYIVGLIATFFSNHIKYNFPTVLLLLGFPLFISLNTFVSWTNFEVTKAFGVTVVCVAYAAVFNRRLHLTLHIFTHLLFSLFLLYQNTHATIDRAAYTFINIFIYIFFYIIFYGKIHLVNELKTKKALMSKVFEDATDALLLFDTDRQSFTGCNTQVLRLFGKRKKEAFLNEKWELLSFFQQQSSAIKSNLAITPTWRKERLIEEPKPIWIELTVSKISEIDNLLLVRITDITERRATKYAWEMTQFTMDQISDILFWTTKEGLILYANEAASKTLGYSKEELKHISIHQIQIPKTKYPKKEISAFWEHLKAEKELNTKARYKIKSGNIIPVEITANYLNFRGNEYICTFVRNMSATTSMLTRIKASEERFRSLFEEGPLGMVLLDMNHKITNVNDTFCQMFGYQREDVIDKPLNDITHTDDQVPVETTLDYYQQKETKRGKRTKVEKRYIKKDGTTLWVMLTSTIIKGSYILAMLEDINSRKKAQEALNIYANKLESSNKELEQFAYVVSHDLQEPLRMVSSYLQLLERRYKDKLDNSGLDFINYAVDGAQRMSGLIQDLLQYSRVNTRGKAFEPSNCNEIMIEVLTNLQTTITESGAKILYDPQSMPTIKVDRSQLSQLLQNLIGNAIKYRSDAGPIIRIEVKEQEYTWLFSIQDNGIGIENDYLKQIFGVFQRLHTRNEYEGSGIGLAICQRIVHRHNGEIWAESEVGKGSTFYFTIPK